MGRLTRAMLYCVINRPTKTFTFKKIMKGGVEGSLSERAFGSVETGTSWLVDESLLALLGRAIRQNFHLHKLSL